MNPNAKIPKLKNPSSPPDHLRRLSKKELLEMLASYQEGLHDNETRSCVVAISDIKFLIEYYSDTDNFKDADKIWGLRFYFYRPDPDKKFAMPNQKLLKVGDKAQQSIIIVPVNHLSLDAKGQYSTEDMFNCDDECYIAHPGGEGTGLCPTNCPRK